MDNPRFMPMVCHPIPWEAYDKGGYLLWRAPIVRTKEGGQLEKVRTCLCPLQQC